MSLVLHGTNGITYPDGKVQLGAAALEQVGSITHTSDTALATQASGGTQIGSAVSMVVPTAGVIRVTCASIEFDETEGSAASQSGIGLKIGSDGISWAVTDAENGALEYTVVAAADASSASVINGPSGWVHSLGSIPCPGIWTWDLDDLSSSNGTLDVEIWMGDNVNSSSGEITVTGTTKTARFFVEVIDGT